MTGILIPIVSSFVLSITGVALMLHLSHKKSWYDHINERKIHTGDIPRLGGVGFAPAFILTAFFVNFFSTDSYFGLRLLPTLLALILILFTGVADDFRPIAPRYKLFLQIAAGLCVIIPGYTFKRLFFFEWEGFPFLPWILYALSFLWVVGLPNAINLVDGVDGLAGGLSLLAALTYILIFTALGNAGTAIILCCCLAAAVGGFLIFNAPIPKAKIFMGDGGAYFIGFTLALLPLLGAENGGGLPLFYAAALLVLPIFDTFAAIWRRIRDKRRIDSPDMHHIHHKLINLGLKAQGIDALLYGLQILIGALVYLSVKYSGFPSLILLGSAYLTGLGFFTVIHFMNRAVVPQPRKTETK